MSFILDRYQQCNKYNIIITVIWHIGLVLFDLIAWVNNCVNTIKRLKPTVYNTNNNNKTNYDCLQITQYTIQLNG